MGARPFKPGAPAEEARRFPLPGLLFALAALAVVHGPLLSIGPLFDEAPFLAGAAESRGATLGMRWLPIEVAALGAGAGAHRLFAFAIELAIVALAAFALRRRRGANLALALVGAALAHPWQTGSFLLLGCRPILVSELLAAAAIAFATAGSGVATTLAAAFLAAGATSGLPLAAAFLLPPLLVARGPALRRAALVAAGAAIGVACWFLAAPPAAPSLSTWAALDLLARPWRTALVHTTAAPIAVCVGAAAILALVLVSVRRRDPLAAALLVASVVAWSAAPGLRPPRTALEYFGPGMTPEGWLPFLALLAAACARLGAAGGLARAPALAFAALSLCGGFLAGTRWVDEVALLDHAIAVEPGQAELLVLRGQRFLEQSAAATPQEAAEFAAGALAMADEAKRRRPGDPAPATLEVLALALSGRFDEARVASDRLLATRPDDWRARAARAELEGQAGDPYAALRWMRAAVAAHAEPRARASLLRLLDQLRAPITAALAAKRFDDALRAAEALIAAAPGDRIALAARVAALDGSGKRTEALEAALALAESDPRDATALALVVRCLEQLGRKEEAREWQQRLVGLAPPQ